MRNSQLYIHVLVLHVPGVVLHGGQVSQCVERKVDDSLRQVPHRSKPIAIPPPAVLNKYSYLRFNSSAVTPSTSSVSARSYIAYCHPSQHARFYMVFK